MGMAMLREGFREHHRREAARRATPATPAASSQDSDKPAPATPVSSQGSDKPAPATPVSSQGSAGKSDSASRGFCKETMAMLREGFREHHRREAARRATPATPAASSQDSDKPAPATPVSS